MASHTRQRKATRRARLIKAGRKRKNESALKSTLSAKELFAELDSAPKKK